MVMPFHGLIALSYLGVYYFIRFFHHHLFFPRTDFQLIWIFILSMAYKALEFGFC